MDSKWRRIMKHNFICVAQQCFCVALGLKHLLNMCVNYSRRRHSAETSAEWRLSVEICYLYWLPQFAGPCSSHGFSKEYKTLSDRHEAQIKTWTQWSQTGLSPCVNLVYGVGSRLTAFVGLCRRLCMCTFFFKEPTCGAESSPRWRNGNSIPKTLSGTRPRQRWSLIQ